MTDEDSNKGGIICCVLLLVIVGILVFIGSQLSSVYFDNGYEDSFDIFVDGKKEGSVAPGSMEEISIKKGEHTIEIRKKDGELFESNDVTLTEFEYIYNIGRKYLYYIEICEYKVGGGTRWGGWATKNIGSETLIKYPKADYGFDEDCPGSIVVSAGNAYEERTNLKKKINPSHQPPQLTPSSATAIENSLVGYWSFDEDSGDVASDLSGNGNDGTIHGAKLVDGKYGMALEFDGKDDYIHIPNSKILEDLTESSFTLEAWAKPLDVPAHTNTNNRNYGIITRPGWHTGLRYTYNKQFSLSLWDSSNTVFDLCSQVYEPGEWHHVVGVTNDSSKKMYIYVDGVLANSDSYSGSSRDYRTLPYRIGAGHNSGDYKYHFNGIIDEVRIYNYALSDDEIKTAMHSIAAPP